MTDLRVLGLGALALGASLIGAPAGAAGPTLAFVDATDGSGIEFSTTSGRTPSGEILDVNGTGIAIADFDGDGDLDLFVANGATIDDTERGPGSRMFANDGTGRFRDVTTDVGLELRRWALGVAVGDYDADGDNDLYVTCFGPNVLLRNDRVGGERRWVDVTERAGVGDPGWGMSAAFGDVDADGDLDLFVANYLDFDPEHPPARGERSFKGQAVFAGPRGLAAQRDVLFDNVGDGRFRDVTGASGVAAARPSYGLGVAILDLDGDGLRDIFVGNDSEPNHHFRNLGDGRLEEIGMLSGLAADFDGRSQATMGVATGDVDDDGRPDVFTTNFSSDSNTLHVNVGRGLFEDRTSRYGLASVSRPFLSWGAGLHDFDSDGDLDLFVASGHIYPSATPETMDSEYEQPLLLLERDGRRFRRATNAGAIFERRFRGRATAFGDLDDDGDLDVVMTSLNDRVRVFRNDAPHERVAVVRLRGRPGNLDALGARVDLIAGERAQRRWIGGGSYLSVDGPAAHFGLGSNAPARVTVRVLWPDGRVTEHGFLPADRHLTISEADGGVDTRPFRGRAGPDEAR